MARNSRQVWLFGPGADIGLFAGSAALSLALGAAAPLLGADEAMPPWAYLLLVVGVDVAHVWSTAFRVYLDGAELRRRLPLYAGLPLALYALGVVAYRSSPEAFWRLFAYAALLHFVRQQVGWMALYGRKEGASRTDAWLDAAAIYSATLGPVLWWHANLPRPFWWFVEGDFVAGLPGWVGSAALGVEAAVLLGWGARQLGRGLPLRVGPWALLLSTAAVWFFGIVVARSDFAFTVTNVVLHGAPYFALLFRYGRARAAEQAPGYAAARAVLARGAVAFVGLLVAVAFLEELLWDRWVWGDHPGLFGAGSAVTGGALALLVPLLALPQATHYVLDAFIWRAGKDAALRARLGFPERSGS